MNRWISIPPSSHSQWSSCEPNSEKWCFEEQEEAKEARRFCQTMWVHHKIITKDIFSTRVYVFVKTTVYVSVETITFWKSKLLLVTHVLLLQSQKLMLPFDDIVPKLYNLCFLLISMSCTFLHQLNDINYILIQETRHFHHFMCCFVIKKIIKT